MSEQKQMSVNGRAEGQSELNAGLGWTNVNDALPCAIGEQVNVLFCSPGWGWSIVGMFTNFGDVKEWSEYDQQNDKYIEWDSTPPTLWMIKPEPPNVEITGG